MDLAKGDKVSLGIDVAAIFVPEAIEALKRVDINGDRVIKNIAEESIEEAANAKLDYTPISGFKLEITPGKTTTVLGTYKDDTANILEGI